VFTDLLTCLKHTLHLVLTYAIESEELTVFPHNPFLFDHFLITFGFTLLDYTASEKKFILGPVKRSLMKHMAITTYGQEWPLFGRFFYSDATQISFYLIIFIFKHFDFWDSIFLFSL